jgi:hypothetical protein
MIKLNLITGGPKLEVEAVESSDIGVHVYSELDITVKYHIDSLII